VDTNKEVFVAIASFVITVYNDLAIFNKEIIEADDLIKILTDYRGREQEFVSQENSAKANNRTIVSVKRNVKHHDLFAQRKPTNGMKYKQINVRGTESAIKSTYDRLKWVGMSPVLLHQSASK
jgi:hypothetical protein